MKTFLSLGALVAVASGAAVDLEVQASPLDVTLEMMGNSLVKASVRNSGDSTLRLFKTGSILGDHATEKTEIFSEGSKVEFDGLRLRLATFDLEDEAFETLPAGETLEVTFNVAETHDLSSGGAFDIISKGMIQYAEPGTNDIAGALPFSSNMLTAQIDGAAATHVRNSFHNKAKRQILQADCTGERANMTQNAISNCGKLAAKAEVAAANGTAAKLEEYFKQSNNATRAAVTAVFHKVAAECANVTTGVARYYCSDVYQSCYSGVLAYTMPSRSFMVNCALYFRALSPLSPQCHAQDQATTTLHETTHLTQIKGTEDYGVYGYKGVRQLSSRQALNHADTYALFANAIHVGC